MYTENLFFRFFVQCVFPAKTTILLELNLPLHELHVFARPVVDPLAHRTLELDEVF